jgi:hypothetical protein
MDAMTAPPTPRSIRLLGRLVVAASACAALLVTPLGLAAAETETATENSSVATTTPPVPGGLPSGIEGLAAYVPANSCSPTARAGTVKLGTLLTSTYSGTRFGGARSCGSLPDSEHHDGRAVDWMNSVRDTTQAAQAKAVLGWLFATDSHGQTYANARRLGVMYVIWNNKIWGAYSADQGWRAYSSCASHPEKGWDTTCHRDHMHLSLSYAGALGHTSFWSKKVAAPDYGRCRPADLNWSYSYETPRATPCPRYPVVRAKSGASALDKSLVNFSGRYLKTGYASSAVTAVQQAVHTSATGSYGATTTTAVKRWQRDHGVPETGTINHTTWRALLKANAPK